MVWCLVKGLDKDLAYVGAQSVYTVDLQAYN